MKKHRTILYMTASVLAVMLILFVLNKPQEKEGTQLVVLSTTDMHGRCWEKDILTNADAPNNMLRVSSAVKGIRDAYGKENVILIDNGDLFQGTSVSEVYMREENSSLNESEPMALCLKEIGYDVLIPGNHEFNYPWETMRRIYEDLRQGNVSVIAANIFYDGTDGTHAKGDTVFEPYVIREVEVNGHLHRIGIFGFENSDITRWDLPENYPGMTFTSPDNPDYDLSLEANLCISLLRKKGCELIILAYHGSLGDDEEPIEFGYNTENQGLRIIENTDGLDLLITGHDHVSGYSGVFETDAAGRDVCVVNAGGTDLTKTVFELEEANDGTLIATIVSTENLALSDYEPDPDLEEKIRPYAELADQKMDEPIGTFAGDWDESEEYWLRQNDTEDFVRAVMIDAGTRGMIQKYGTSVPETLESLVGLDHLDVDAAVTSVQNYGYVMKSGPVATRDIYRMVRFSDHLLVIPIAGSDLKAIMEENASERLTVRVLNNEPVYLTKNDQSTYLIFGGINFSYDMAKPAGERVIISGFSNGRPFNEDDVYLIAVNNYQLDNERGLLWYYSEEDALWSQKHDSSSDDTIQRSIEDFIKRKSADGKAITPDVINWNWEIVYSADPSGVDVSEEPVLATYAEKPEDGHRYLIYCEAQECVMSGTAASAGYQTIDIPSSGNSLVGELPEDAVIFTAHLLDDDSLTLTDAYGRVFTCGAKGGLSFKEKPEDDDRTVWQIIPVRGGYHLKAEGEGSEAFLDYYGETVTTYKEKADSSYLFNFYNLNDGQ